MKVSAKQLTASVIGAVAAAVLASVLSQKGTIIGVAIGSAVATMATALAGRSIERTHDIVRTVVKEPAVPELVRRFAPNKPLGEVEYAPTSSSIAPPDDAAKPEPVHRAAPRRPSLSDAPAARPRPHRQKQSLRLKRSWQVLVALTVVIFIAAAGIVTAIEALTQQPLSTLVGSGHTHGFSVNNLVTGGSPSTPSTTVPATTSTTSTTSGSTSTTTSTSSTTTTTAPPSTTAPRTSTPLTSSTTTTTQTPGTTSP